MKPTTLGKAVALFLSVLVCSLSLVSCQVTLRSGENGLYDKKNRIAYSHASTVYEARALRKEYGKLMVTDKLSYVLYTIPGAEPTEMLATEDFNILYASDTYMPTLMEMMPTILRVCTDSHEIKRIEDAAVVAALAKQYAEGESIPYTGITPIHIYKVRFESLNYPGFYYTLTYGEYAEPIEIDGISYGRYFLHDAFDRRFVPVGDSIHMALDLK